MMQFVLISGPAGLACFVVGFFACFVVGFLLLDRASRPGHRSRWLAGGALLAFVLGVISLSAAVNIWLLGELLPRRGW